RIWMRGKDFVVAIHLHRPQCCEFYHIYVELYLDRSAKRLSESGVDSLIPASSLLSTSAATQPASLDFEPGRWSGTELERRDAVVQLLTDELIPVAAKMSSRRGLAEVVTSLDLIQESTLWMREEIAAELEALASDEE
ncbi:MAG: hypothetical protein ACF8NJ_06370, partial [Phycisphaerales bacterium JB038]